jgi:hypothetical protein
MPPESGEKIQQTSPFTRLNTITPLSKYLAMVLFVLLPFVAFYLGLQFAPVQYVEVEQVVFRENPSKNNTESQSVPVEEEPIVGHPAGYIDLHAVESQSSQGIPESDIYVGNELVLRASGSCSFEYENELPPNRSALTEIIGDHRIIDRGICWYGGGGAEFYTFAKGDVLTLVGMPIGECGNLPVSECSGFGEPQVLYERDTAGVVTTRYNGPLFGG